MDFDGILKGVIANNRWAVRRRRMKPGANTTFTERGQAISTMQEEMRRVVLGEMRTADQLATLSGRRANEIRSDLDQWVVDGRMLSVRHEGVDYFALFVQRPVAYTSTGFPLGNMDQAAWHPAPICPSLCIDVAARNARAAIRTIPQLRISEKRPATWTPFECPIFASGTCKRGFKRPTSAWGNSNWRDPMLPPVIIPSETPAIDTE